MGKKITFVEGAHRWWKWFSTWCFTAIAGIQASLVLLPLDVTQAHVPFTAATTWKDIANALSIGLALLGPLLTAIKQGPKPPSFEDTEPEPPPGDSLQGAGAAPRTNPQETL